ncbi:MAG: DUF805 domain-containing protein, partial [Prevotella sp.]|nr:DUF805 domain-containing protein [Prevotella sp.]
MAQQQLSFMEAITHCGRNLTNFKGRARRSELWWNFLLAVIMQVVTQRVSEILHFLLLTFFLAYIQTTEAKSQSPCLSYGASIMNGELCCGHQEDSAFAM